MITSKGNNETDDKKILPSDKQEIENSILPELVINDKGYTDSQQQQVTYSIATNFLQKIALQLTEQSSEVFQVGSDTDKPKQE